MRFYTSATSRSSAKSYCSSGETVFALDKSHENDGGGKDLSAASDFVGPCNDRLRGPYPGGHMRGKIAERFVVLDGLRGAAAFAVVTVHASSPTCKALFP